MRELRYVHHVMGEKGTCKLTEILRHYPFPEVAHGHYLPEGIVWLDIAKRFKSRAVNEVFRVYYIDDDEIGVTVNKKKSFSAHALGRWYFYVWLLNNDLGYFFRSPITFLKAAILLPVVARFSHRSIKFTILSLESHWAKALVLLTSPIAALLCAIHKTKSEQNNIPS
jgi:hypothetical protein